MLFSRSPALEGIHGPGLVAVAIASLAGNILLFAIPLYSLQVYDRVLTSRSLDTLWLLTLITIFALVASAVIDGLRARLLTRIGNRYALAMGPRLVDACLLQSARTLETSTQPLRDMAVVRGFVSSPQGLAALFDAPLVPIFLFGVYLIHPGLGHTMLFGILVLIALAVATEWLTGSHLREANNASILAQSRIDGVMRNAEAAEAMGMRAALRDYWQEAQGEALAKSTQAGDWSAQLNALAKGIRMFLSLLVSAAGAWYAIRDQITIGGMVAASIIAARGLAPLEVLIGAWKNLVGTRASIGRLEKIIGASPRAESGMTLPRPQGLLTVERVVFAPPGMELPTLKGVSFVAPAGNWIGLIGPSGAGKTTLARIICGIWQPRSGMVRLDNADVYTWNRSDFGQHCGYLPQDVELFAGSVRDNIARFSNTEDAAVIDAARLAGCHDMILRLPKGYDTKVGSGGTALSAGQRQRIGLARALFGSPRLVVLDEPNANLDSEGEQALVQAMNAVRQNGATLVMISHRPTLLAGCDLLAVLVDGQLQHFGPRNEVLAKLQPPQGVKPISEAQRSGT